MTHIRNTANAAVLTMALAVATATALFASPPANAAGDAEAGRDKAFTCMGCHGAPGYRNAYPAYTVPKLGGQHGAYIALALRAYRSKERSHPTMQAHAAGLSDRDIEDIAAYFSGLKPRP